MHINLRLWQTMDIQEIDVIGVNAVRNIGLFGNAHFSHHNVCYTTHMQSSEMLYGV